MGESILGCAFSAPRPAEIEKSSLPDVTARLERVLALQHSGDNDIIVICQGLPARPNDIIARGYRPTDKIARGIPRPARFPSLGEIDERKGYTFGSRSCRKMIKLKSKDPNKIIQRKYCKNEQNC